MKRIFFVEDDLSLINGLTFAVREQGYGIDVARTRLEAKRLWADGKYDLVIL
ncbi:MAG: DNA-binding response regulator, partial [Lachnospiraceae bacterium]|nr:DNA-binding response regulator [Lachnospiraceae bacterium]